MKPIVKLATFGDAPYFTTNSLTRNPTVPDIADVLAASARAAHNRTLFLNMLIVEYTKPLKPAAQSISESLGLMSPASIAFLRISTAPGVDFGKARKMIPKRMNTGNPITNPIHQRPTHIGC